MTDTWDVDAARDSSALPDAARDRDAAKTNA